MDIEIATKAIKTWSDGSYCTRFWVWADGTVLAWNNLARCFNRNHSLTNRQMARIRYLARKSVV